MFRGWVLHVWRLGDSLVVVVYFLPLESKHAPGKYCDVLDFLLEMVGRMYL